MDDIVKNLNHWEDVIFRHESEFMTTFCKQAFDLHDISWNGERMRFTYILSCGQMASDSVEIDKWFAFLEQYGK